MKKCPRCIFPGGEDIEILPSPNGLDIDEYLSRFTITDANKQRDYMRAYRKRKKMEKK